MSLQRLTVVVSSLSSSSLSLPPSLTTWATCSARAYHIDDLRKNETLEVDIDYYLKNQIHPVVGRMMEPIEGTDNAQIAMCLGLDPGAFRREYTMQVRGSGHRVAPWTVIALGAVSHSPRFYFPFPM